MPLIQADRIEASWLWWITSTHVLSSTPPFVHA